MLKTVFLGSLDSDKTGVRLRPNDRTEESGQNYLNRQTFPDRIEKKGGDSCILPH